MAEKKPERKPMMSGHCATPATADPESSHLRCAKHGAGSTANPAKIFHPCPCGCHLGETYECGGCGRPIREAPYWPNDDEPGEMVYQHVDAVTGQAVGEFCA